MRISDWSSDIGISAKVLTERLEGLEQAGVVQRRQLPPPAATQIYELTEWGYQAEDAIKALGRWAAASPDLDTTLPLSAASLMMSFRTMFDPERAEDLALTGSIRIGERNEEHTSELQSLMRSPYAVFCLTQKKKTA